MKLKKFGALFSGALLVASLAACGSASDSGESAAAGGEGTAKTYEIVTDTAFAPFEYTDENNELVGVDVEMLDAIAKDQGFDYDLQPVGFDAALQNVQAGQADGVIAGMSITAERAKVFDFSDPYYDSNVCCAAMKDGDVKSLEDLKGQNVAVKNGTQSQKWAEEIAEEYGFTTTTFDTSDVMYQDVEAGNSVACFEDTPVMSDAINRGGKEFAIIAEADAGSDYATPYGFAVRKGDNAELLQMFNDGLANIKDNGTYDKIVDKYVQSVE